LTLIFSLTGILFAQSQKVIEITVKKNQSIREIAKKYLGDPDLWEAILKYNNLETSSDAKPGVILKIPIRDFKKAKGALNEAIKAIREASRSGANLFAQSGLSRAEKLYNEALNLQKNGDFLLSYDKAAKAKQFAGEAKKLSVKKRNVKTSAVLTDKQGDVESMQPDQSVWKDLNKPDKLNEGDKVRTLSNSFAEITFYDGNRIKLNSNAQALIQKMREDLFEKKKESSVKIVEGDAFAYLTGGSSKKKFNVIIPGLETKVKSKNFWVKKERKRTKIANYEGEIEIKSKGQKVVLQENEKTIVSASGRIAAPQKILTAPKLLSPVKGNNVYEEKITFTWTNIPKTKEYWLEISTDKDFKNVVLFKKKIKQPRYSISTLVNGIYFWRVFPIDSDDIPGQKSKAESFVLSPNAEAPYLTVLLPMEGAIVTENSVVVSGKTEIGGSVLINGEAEKIDKNGKFEKHISVNPGANKISVKAVSKNGIENEIFRNIYYDTPGDLKIAYDGTLNKIGNNKFIFSAENFSFGGITRPRSLVELKNAGGKNYRGYSDSRGKFKFNISQKEKESAYLLKIETVSGFSLEDSLWFIVDNEAPVITLSIEPPFYTDKNSVELRGAVTETCKVKINGADAALNKNNFSKEVKLSSGVNIIRITAEDIAGNENVIEREIYLDDAPPIITGKNIRKKIINGKTAIIVKIGVSDTSGLKNTARLKALLGKEVKYIFAKYNKSAQTYEAVVYFPNSDYTPSLVSILLEDYFGNKKEYRIN